MTPPERLLRLHRHSLVNVLVLGGTVETRLQVAYTFHRRSRLRRGPFVRVDGATDQHALRQSLQGWMSGNALALQMDPIDPLGVARGGTLFIDSIGSLGAETQRVMSAFMRDLNSDWPGRAQAWGGRLAAGNAEHLSRSVAEGRFSMALYDFLDKVRVELPVPRRGL